MLKYSHPQWADPPLPPNAMLLILKENGIERCSMLRDNLLMLVKVLLFPD
jgi:hypothetical protein